jgi:hypothetical protein
LRGKTLKKIWLRSEIAVAAMPPAQAARQPGGRPGCAYGGVLQRGAGLPVGVVPAAAWAGDRLSAS